MIRVFHSRKFYAVNDSSCAVIYVGGRGGCLSRNSGQGGAEGDTKKIGDRNQKMCRQRPSMKRVFHSRKFCAVNDSSCAAIYVRG